jgi:aryl-alcohol dehydrogenase-like predicted oxidoreductase
LGPQIVSERRQSRGGQALLGRALKDFARREEVVIATKVHGRMRPGPNGAGLSRLVIMTEIDNSLRRLGTDYVDPLCCRDAIWQPNWKASRTLPS